MNQCFFSHVTVNTLGPYRSTAVTCLVFITILMTKEIPTEIELDEDVIDPLISPISDNNQIEKSKKTLCERFSGIIYAALATTILTSSAFITKQLNVNLLDAIIPRLFVQMIMLIIYMRMIKKYSFYNEKSKSEIFFLTINNIGFTTGFVSFFLAYHFLPLPDAVTLRYTQVTWTVILASIIYKEKPSIPIIVAVLMATSGITLVAQPDFIFSRSTNVTLIDQNANTSYSFHPRIFGICLALYCSLAMSTVVLSNKHLLTKFKTKHSLIMFQFILTTFIVITSRVIFRYVNRKDGWVAFKMDFLNWRYCLASIVCLGQILSSIFTQKAIKREHPSVFTIVQSSDILFSIMLQNFFTEVHSNTLSICGSILVLTSLLIVSGEKFLKDKWKTEKNKNQV